MTTDFSQCRQFVGIIAWGDGHSVVALNPAGETVLEFEFGAFGWRDFQEKLAGLAAPAIAAEFMFGTVIDQLTTRGYTFYPINPDNLRLYLEPMRGAEAQGGKPLARLMADALRRHGAHWKTMTPQDKMLTLLRQVWAEEKKSRNFFVEMMSNLEESLSRHFSEILPVFDWTRPASWQFVQDYPTPGNLRRAKRHHIDKFLKLSDQAGTPSGEKCLALMAKLNKTSDLSPSLPMAEEEVRRTAKILVEAWQSYRRTEFLTAKCVTVHPDYAHFGPASPSPSAPSTPEPS